MGQERLFGSRGSDPHPDWLGTAQRPTAVSD